MINPMRPEIKQYIALGIVLVGIIVLCAGVDMLMRGAWHFTLPSQLSGKQGEYERYANVVMENCKKESYPPSCYDREIPKLLDKGLTMEDAFAITSIIQQRTNGYFFCHVLGHNLAGKETAKDPSKWTEVIARCPTGMCSNGCLHGAAQERFRSESLTPEQIETVIPQLAQVCESGHGRSFTGLESASCYHALGHLTMYITNADITASTRMCDRVAKKGERDFTQTCYEGAYMQIFQPLEPEDFGLVKDIAPTTPQEALTYCNTFSGERRNACHRESWPLSREALMKPGGLRAFCEVQADPASETRCYNAMFYILVAQMNFDDTRVSALCEGLPDDRKGQCFANAASRYVETDYRLANKAAGLCKIAEQQGVGDRCYQELLFYSSYNYHEGSKEFVSLCKDLPQPWQSKCLAGDGKSIRMNQSGITQ